MQIHRKPWFLLSGGGGGDEKRIENKYSELISITHVTIHNLIEVYHRYIAKYN
jgi:hypothetical protein